MPAKRLLLGGMQLAARAIRLAIAGIEKIAPELSARMRRWAWIWQPVYSHSFLNKFYENKEDPFNFHSRQEIEKYELTIKLLEGRTYARALEVGAAEGLFTEMMAPFCDQLIGLEVAEIAVRRAKDRLAHLQNVEFIQGALPMDMPDSSFDLIILSDILVYFPSDVLRAVALDLESVLRPGGVLFCMHYLGRIGAPVLGAKAHEILKHQLSLPITYESRLEDAGPSGQGYDILIFEKPA